MFGTNLKYFKICITTLLFMILAACAEITTPQESLKFIAVKSLDSTSVELSFNKAVSGSATVIENYNINGLTVIEASVSNSTVLLRTSEQANQSYSITVMNIKGMSGEGLGADGNALSFVGKAPSVSSKSLKLLSVTSLDSTSVELSFNNPLGPSAAIASNYQIEGLTVEGAVIASVSDFGTAAITVSGGRVTLKTSRQDSRTYLVEVSNVLDEDGNALDPSARSASFEGTGLAAASSKVQIVNLSQSILTTDSCIKAGERNAIISCVEQSIRAEFPDPLNSIDVFVAGNSNEQGAWKQFNTMNLPVEGRAYLSLQYKHESSLLNALLYDADVIDGRASLIELLYTLQTRFPETSVRVFGHSQGSHVVALVADEPSFSNMKFFAIAQAGRTAVDIDSSAEIKAGKKGDPGYIHKLSNNLVGITWLNDEVKFYTGKGYVGTMMPEKWGFPGYIWQNTTDGTLSSQARIDHHNSYGGRYTDGLASNDWRKGDGFTTDNYPYCATGDKSAFDNGNECEKQDTHNSPFFWDNVECRNKAFEMMDSAAIGEKYFIGYSGPRSAGCRDNVAPIQVNYKLEYRINIGDVFSNHCRYDLMLNFEGLNFSDVPYTRQNGGSITVSTSSSSDTGWLVKTGRISIPYHMRIYLGGNMTDISGSFSDCNGPAYSEAYVRSFEVSFNHPDSGRPITRTLIGLEEGKGYIPPVDLNKKNNVAWYQWDNPNDSRDTDWQLYRAPSPWNALMIKGETDGNRRGHFFKWLHLID